jgi:hypothetical protein
MMNRPELKDDKKADRLKDRQDYRETLVRRREDIDRKIAETEAQIKSLKAS